jgi:hypothetical protein
MLLLHSMQSNVADGCFVYSSKSRTPVHRGGTVSQIISVISRYIHTSNNYMQSIQETARFCNPSRDFGAGTLARGNTYEIFFAYTRLSLSLSLSLSPLEERAKEERLGGVGPWSGPTTRGLPYPADAYLTTLAYPTSPTCALLPPAGCRRAAGTRPVAIRHTLDRYGAMPPFVVHATTRPVSITYASNQYGATPPFVTRFCRARRVQPPGSPFSVAPIQRHLPINLH